MCGYRVLSNKCDYCDELFVGTTGMDLIMQEQWHLTMEHKERAEKDNKLIDFKRAYNHTAACYDGEHEKCQGKKNGKLWCKCKCHGELAWCRIDKSRKEFICDQCGSTILTGSKYYYPRTRYKSNRLCSVECFNAHPDWKQR